MRNIFEDFETPEDAVIKHQKSQLLIRIVKAHRASGQSQAALAKLLKLSPPRVSDMLKGHMEKFSTEMLQRICMRMGLPHLALQEDRK